MDEAAIEEALGEFRFTGGLTTDGGVNATLWRQAAMLLVLIGLRLRRVVLPFLVAGVASITLVGDSGFSALSILLNLLAVAFITEADNIMAAFALPHDAQSLSAPLIAAARAAGHDKMPLWLAHRALAFACSGLVVYIILSFRAIDDRDIRCDQVNGSTRAKAYVWSFYCLYVYFAGQVVLDAFVHLSNAKHAPGGGQWISRTLATAFYNLSLNMSAWLFACMLNFVAFVCIYGDVPHGFFCASATDIALGGTTVSESCLSLDWAMFLETSSTIVFTMAAFVFTMMLRAVMPASWLHWAADHTNDGAVTAPQDPAKAASSVDTGAATTVAKAADVQVVFDAGG